MEAGADKLRVFMRKEATPVRVHTAMCLERAALRQSLVDGCKDFE
jgi:hypothetical protein